MQIYNLLKTRDVSEYSLVDFYDVDDNSDVAAGDQVIVLPRVDAKTLQAVKDITQIIYQIAVAANVALN